MGGEPQNSDGEASAYPTQLETAPAAKGDTASTLSNVAADAGSADPNAPPQAVDPGLPDFTKAAAGDTPGPAVNGEGTPDTVLPPPPSPAYGEPSGREPGGQIPSPFLFAILVIFAIAAAGVAAWAISRIDSIRGDWPWLALAVVAVAVCLASLGVAVDIVRRWFHQVSELAGIGSDRGIGSALLGSAPLVIGVATTATVVAYILPPSHQQWFDDLWNYFAVGTGIVAALVVSAIYSLVQRGHTAAENTNPRQHGELSLRLSSLDARVRLLCPPEGASATDLGARTRAIACEEARVHRNYIANDLATTAEQAATPQRAGAKWVLGSGFIDLWVRLHKAEAALLVVEPKAEVIASALDDEGRLVGSNIDNSDDLLRKLRAAVMTLGGKKYLSSDAAALLQNVEDATEGEPQTPAQIEAQIEARLILGNVRHAISEFRDARREGLTRTRNQLMWTGMVTAVMAYGILALAVLVGAERSTIVAATAFFLVGAVVGLFAQLRTLSGGEAVPQEDFGLARTRLLYTPVLSGLAGVGGVLVITMLYASLNGPVLHNITASASTSSTSTAVAGGGTIQPVASAETPHLEKIFDLEADRFGLVIAAIFGLTPALLVNKLQGQADQFQDDLQSTSVQTRS